MACICARYEARQYRDRKNWEGVGLKSDVVTDGDKHEDIVENGVGARLMPSMVSRGYHCRSADRVVRAMTD